MGENVKNEYGKVFIALIAACIALTFSGCKEKESQVEIAIDSPVVRAPKVDAEEQKDSCDVAIHFSKEMIKQLEREHPVRRSAFRPYLKPGDFGIKSENGKGRAASDVMKVLRRCVPKLRLIYNKYLEKKPGFEGWIVIEFTITPKGKITNISIVSSNTYFEEFDSEIVKAISHWKFPKIKSGNTNVKLPFSFYE